MNESLIGNCSLRWPRDHAMRRIALKQCKRRAKLGES